MYSLHKMWVTLSTLAIPENDKKSDQGAGFVEYGAILVLVSIIAVAVMSTGLDRIISQGITNAVYRALSL